MLLFDRRQDMHADRICIGRNINFGDRVYACPVLADRISKECAQCVKIVAESYAVHRA